jgi:hypothetical protein
MEYSKWVKVATRRLVWERDLISVLCSASQVDVVSVRPTPARYLGTVAET